MGAHAGESTVPVHPAAAGDQDPAADRAAVDPETASPPIRRAGQRHLANTPCLEAEEARSARQKPTALESASQEPMNLQWRLIFFEGITIKPTFAAE